jgi:hypothetical protein
MVGRDSTDLVCNSDSAWRFIVSANQQRLYQVRFSEPIYTHHSIASLVIQKK